MAHTYLRRRLEPVYYDMAPHAVVVLLQTLPPHASSVFFERTREKPICSGGAFKMICTGDPYPRVPEVVAANIIGFLFSLCSCTLE